VPGTEYFPLLARRCSITPSNGGRTVDFFRLCSATSKSAWAAAFAAWETSTAVRAAADWLCAAATLVRAALPASSNSTLRRSKSSCAAARSRSVTAPTLKAGCTRSNSRSASASRALARAMAVSVVRATSAVSASAFRASASAFFRSASAFVCPALARSRANL
jgi:hypothetical protein